MPIQHPNDYKQVRENFFEQALGTVAIVLDAELSAPCRAIYVGTSGDATLHFADGSTDTFPGLLAGVVYPFAINKVSTSGTTASNLKALY